MLIYVATKTILSTFHYFQTVLGIYSDALAAVKYVKNRVDLDSSKVVIMGRSLGGAIAIETATHPECSDIFALILENTFTSLPDIAKRVLNISLIKVTMFFESLVLKVSGFLYP